MVRCFDYGNIQILFLEGEKKKNPQNSENIYNQIHKRILFSSYKNPEKKNQNNSISPPEKRKTHRVIAIDVGESDFGGVLESTISFPPSLKRAHL